MNEANDRNMIYGVGEASLSGGALSLPVSKKAFLSCQTSGSVTSIATDGLLTDGLCLTLINTSAGVVEFDVSAAKGTSVARAIQPDGAATLVRINGEWRII